MKVIKFDQFLNEEITIDELDGVDWNYKDFPHDFRVVGGEIKTGDLVGVFWTEGVSQVDRRGFMENGGQVTKHGLIDEIFIVGKIGFEIKKWVPPAHFKEKKQLYIKGHYATWFYADECKKLELIDKKDELKDFVAYRRRKKE